MLRFLQINLHHSRAATAALLQTLDEGNYDVALIQEPWIDALGAIQGLVSRNFKLFYCQNKGKKRTAILTKKCLNIILKQEQCTADLTTVVCQQADGKSLLIASCYMAHNNTAPPEELQKLIQESEATGAILIIGTDANAHNTLWGSPKNNERGESLSNFILSTRLSIGNQGSEPTYVGPTSKNVLDITLYTDNNGICLTDWKILNKASFSDHKYISFSISFNIQRIIKSFRNPEKTDWAKYLSIVNGRLRNKPPTLPKNEIEIENANNQLSKILMKAFIISCPIKNSKSKPKPPWWNTEIENESKIIKRLFKDARKYDTTEYWNEYRCQLKHYKKTLRTAKRKSWQNFCGKIESTTETARLRKILTKNEIPPIIIQNDDNTWTKCEKDTLELLLNTHFPGCQSNVETLPRSIQINETVPNFLTESRIEWALKSFKPYKSPGPDGIYPAMLQNCIGLITPWLIEIFTASIKHNYIPISWREAKVVFIPKGGKTSHVKAKDYRPICLTSFLLKTLERILESSIREKLPKTFLQNTQHAYQKGKSVETALHAVTLPIESALEKKDYAICAFLDIEGAFNNVTQEALVNSLERANVNPYIKRWINNMLQSRIIKAEWGTTKLERTATRGTPQGGVISPLLWILTVDEILKDMNKNNINIVAYADDVVITTTGKNLNKLSLNIENALKDVLNWASTKGLNINPNKTEIVLYTRKYKIPSFRKITLNNIEIPIADKAKFLGIIIDKKLSWKDNISERIKKAYNAFYACKKMFGKTWGLSPKVTYWIYTSIVRPILLYGVTVWWCALDTAVNRQRLTKVQRDLSVCITGAMKTTSTESLNTILNLIPLDLFAKSVAYKTALRLKESNWFSLNNFGHSNIENINDISTDYNVPTSIFNRNFSTKFPSRNYWLTREKDPNDSISLYTDGSKQDEGVGCGFYIPATKIEKSYKLPNDCSIFQAEIAAILMSVKHLIGNAENEKINIYIDSQAAIKALEKLTYNSKIVLECRKKLDILSEKNEITLIWVPGHQNIDGNEKADELAKNGVLSNDTPLDIKLPLRQYFKTYDKQLKNVANTEYKNSTSSKITKIFFGEYEHKKTDIILSLERNKCKTLVGVITGHCLVGSHAHRLGLINNTWCRNCNEPDEEETVEHIICHCPALVKQRLDSFGQRSFNSLNDCKNLNLRKILSYAIKTSTFDLDKTNEQRAILFL